MELCTIETSEMEVEAEIPSAADEDILATDPADVEQMSPLVEPADRINEDDLQVEDEALLAAASEFHGASSNQTRERATWVAALTLAVFIHVAAAAVCMLLAIVVRAPLLSFTQGSGSSESGLVSEKSNQTESQESGVPGPMVAVPEIQKTITAEPRTADENQNDPEFSPEQVRPITVLASDAQLPDAPAIGITTDPLGPMPARHHAAPKDAMPKDVPASVTASVATGNMGAHAIGPASSGSAVSAGHSFVAPRGAGHPGIGAEGSGFDSRGLPVPEYPAESKRRHEEGLVELDVQVQPDGSIAAARILKDSGYPRLNNAALASIRAARFSPATVDGIPVSARVIVPYRFILQ